MPSSRHRIVALRGIAQNQDKGLSRDLLAVCNCNSLFILIQVVVLLLRPSVILLMKTTCQIAVTVAQMVCVTLRFFASGSFHIKEFYRWILTIFCYSFP